MKKKKHNSMRLNNIVKVMAILSIAFFSFASCEDDFSDVGSNIVDNNNFASNLFDATSITASTKKMNRVQTNSLSSYAIGVYSDPFYGKKTANMLTQLSLRSTDPDFGNSPVVDSVVLAIPYFSTITAQTIDGPTYELDSVYGNNPVKLSIYESNYFLRDVDPNDDYNPQAYYSDQTELFENNLDPDPLYVIDEFTPSANPAYYIVQNSNGEIDTTAASPRLKLLLDKDFFQQKIMDRQGDPELVSNSNFQNYFRGLYFKTEAINGNNGGYTFFDFSQHGDTFSVVNDANITIYYHTDFGNGEVDGLSYTLRFGSTIVNTFENENNTLPSDQNLYLKGGQGAMAEVDVFTNEEQLDSIREQNWLINEANLTFYVNQNEIAESSKEPMRLFVYDIKNKRVLKDYSYDITINSNNPDESRQVHLSPLYTDNDGNRYYKLRITEYVNDIIQNDSTNTRLGIVVTQNVNIANQLKAEVEGDETITTVPSTSIISPEGTVLYGTQASDEAKRLKLNIFYTEPK